MKHYNNFYLSELQLQISSNQSSDDVDSKLGSRIRTVAVFATESKNRWIEFRQENEDGSAGDLIARTDANTECQFFPSGPSMQLWHVKDATPSHGDVMVFPHRTLLLQFPSPEASTAFSNMVKDWAGSAIASGSAFDKKIEVASSKMYFHYYGQLLHQQNMLQDYIRTGTYYAAVLENRVDFEGKVVVDVGAGSGILSLFAAQAGARHVYAVEASPMAEYAKKLAAGNSAYSQRITVIHAKVEDVDIPEKADILISEPMGTLLVNERMLESYIIARERFLKPKGKMFPSLGRIHMAPFSDEYLYVEIANKALFWQQQSYHGVDLTPLYPDAFKGYFNQPVVDAFDPRLLVAPAITHSIDFLNAKEEDLFEINIPLDFRAVTAARVHGLACWFDVLFDGSHFPRWLSTAPGSPTTHWYQIRCVLTQPLYVMAGQQITGNMNMKAHSAQSYTIQLTMAAVSMGGVTQTASAQLDLKEPYYRMSQASNLAWAQDMLSGEVHQQQQQQQQQFQQSQGQRVHPQEGRSGVNQDPSAVQESMDERTQTNSQGHQMASSNGQQQAPYTTQHHTNVWLPQAR